MEAEMAVSRLSFIDSVRTQWAAQLDDGIGHTLVSTPAPAPTCNGTPIQRYGRYHRLIVPSAPFCFDSGVRRGFIEIHGPPALFLETLACNCNVLTLRREMYVKQQHRNRHG